MDPVETRRLPRLDLFYDFDFFGFGLDRIPADVLQARMAQSLSRENRILHLATLQCVIVPQTARINAPEGTFRDATDLAVRGPEDAVPR